MPVSPWSELTTAERQVAAKFVQLYTMANSRDRSVNYDVPTEVRVRPFPRLKVETPFEEFQ